MNIFLRFTVLALLISPFSLFAEDDEVEEVVVTGSQISYKEAHLGLFLS